MNGRDYIVGGSWKTGLRNNAWKQPRWAAGADFCISIYLVDDAEGMEPWSRG